MKEQFVTYEIALKLKNIGFDEECLAVFYQGRFMNDHIEPYVWNLVNSIKTNSDCNSLDIVTTPLWQQVIDWLRENYNIYIWEQPINSFIDDEEELNSCIFIYQRGITDSPNEYDDKEQAILKAIELCKEKKN